MTLQQIHYFLSLCENDNRAETEPIKNKTIRELKLFLVKNDLGAVKPQYIPTPKTTVAEKLGLDLDSPDLETRRAAAHELWMTNPHLCTPEEIKQAEIYRYENDLMSPDEEATFEEKM